MAQEAIPNAGATRLLDRGGRTRWQVIPDAKVLWELSGFPQVARGLGLLLGLLPTGPAGGRECPPPALQAEQLLRKFQEGIFHPQGGHRIRTGLAQACHWCRHCNVTGCWQRLRYMFGARQLLPRRWQRRRRQHRTRRRHSAGRSRGGSAVAAPAAPHSWGQGSGVGCAGLGRGRPLHGRRGCPRLLPTADLGPSRPGCALNAAAATTGATIL
mmetsp:Transcript_45089/g.143644  ORF Transcript_45089/g.143644 Transcript_45089/m.143644 type:complete len:213 (+) Transcript_45089:835-1473(+)